MITYCLSSSITEEDLIQLGFQKDNWHHFNNRDAWYCKSWHLYEKIKMTVHINLTTREWDNYRDIDIGCEDGQPYTTFYEYLEGSMTMSPFLNNVIDAYEKQMSQLISDGILILLKT